MTKNQFIDLQMRWLGGGTAPADIRKKYPWNIVKRYTEMGYSAYVNEVYKADRDRNNVYLDSLTKPYSNVAVAEDTTRGEKYSIIPTIKLFQLPDNAAIRQIIPVQNDVAKMNLAFVMRNNNTSWIFSQLEVDTQLDRVRYYVEDGNIFFSTHIDDLDPVPTKVLMKLVVPLSEYSGDEQLTIPIGGDLRIFQLVVESLRQQPPMDEVVDSQAKQTGQ